MKFAQNKIIINNKEYDYLIERKKIKNIYFRVKEDMIIHVSAHPIVSEKHIQKLLIDNASSILKMYQRKERKTDESLYYLGEKLNFQYRDCKPFIEYNTIYGKDPLVCQEHIYSIALAIFNQRLIALKEMFSDLPVFRLRTRKMTSKWGVCNHRSMSITLNTFLIAKNYNLIDYVIIHELCHFKHMDHSNSYWTYVSKFCPYYKELRKELNY